MNITDIEYLTHTWNPIAMRCTRVAAGCTNCWHLTMANRLAHNPKIDAERQAAYAGGNPVLIQSELDAPGKIKKPSRIGVQFMGDLFHEDVRRGYMFDVFMAMSKTRHLGHKYIILTKRPEKMLDVIQCWIDDGVTFHEGCTGRIPNFIWLGVSISTNDDLWMVDKLLEIPAAVRFVSIEPMLEHIHPEIIFPSIGLNWVICGAETGNGKRHYENWWGELIRNVCKRANTPFFFKQDGDGNNAIDGKVYQEYPNV